MLAIAAASGKYHAFQPGGFPNREAFVQVGMRETAGEIPFWKPAFSKIEIAGIALPALSRKNFLGCKIDLPSPFPFHCFLALGPFFLGLRFLGLLFSCDFLLRCPLGRFLRCRLGRGLWSRSLFLAFLAHDGQF